MDSLFFNITDTSSKISDLYKKNNHYIKKIDISNGIVFFDISLENYEGTIFRLNNFDKMIFIPVIIEGELSIIDNINNKKITVKQNNMSLYCSSKQDFIFTIKNQKTKMFILFVADFYLKRHLSINRNELIDFLYEQMQKNITLSLIDTLPIDALSLYIIDKIVNTEYTNMVSIKKEHSVMEFMIHRFSLVDFYDKSLDTEELYLANKAKNYLLDTFVNPPTIKELAHLCATNESKLKKVFNKVYKITIYKYIQQLKLNKANFLLKEHILNIGQISAKIGYKHQGHFSKKFFEYYGVYPKDLLKN